MRLAAAVLVSDKYKQRVNPGGGGGGAYVQAQTKSAHPGQYGRPDGDCGGGGQSSASRSEPR